MPVNGRCEVCRSPEQQPLRLFDETRMCVGCEKVTRQHDRDLRAFYIKLGLIKPAPEAIRAAA